MSSTVIRVANFADHEQTLKDVRQVKRLTELRDALKEHLLTGETITKLARASALAREAADELEKAVKAARVDRRARSGRAIGEIIRSSRTAAAALQRAAVMLEEGGSS